MPAHARRWTAAPLRATQDQSRAWPRYELIDVELIVTPVPRLDLDAFFARVHGEHRGEG